jgi:Zn ribbon nucleic-acid-binding protein
MTIALQSDFTFSIPRNIRDYAGSNTGRIKRISADDAVPVILQGNKVLNTSEDIKAGRYIAYKEGVGLNSIVTRRIDTVSEVGVLETGLVSVDEDKKSIVGQGTTFTTQYFVGQKIQVVGEEVTIKTITDDTHMEIYEKFSESFIRREIYSFIYQINLQNPKGENWNTFPTVDTLCMWCEEDNVKYLFDDCVECYYKVQSDSTSQLVFDIDYTPDQAVDLKIERSSYRYEITRERVRNEDIFNSDSYINEAKDTAGTIAQNIYTWSNTGIDEKVSLRHEFNITLVDQLLKIKIYPADMDLETGATALSDWDLKIDVRENVLGKRYNTNFRTV